MHPDLPRIGLWLAGILIIAGTVLHGVGIAEFQRVWDNVIARPSGSLGLRFLLQPAMSIIIALRDGIKDARTGRSPYLWTVLSDPDKRGARLREGLAATGKILLLAILLDGVYQLIEFKMIYPLEALIVAVLLALIPYLLLRGPVARIARWWLAHKSAGPAP
jgi:hypothetical protein